MQEESPEGLYSLQSEICRTLRIKIGCTDARTNIDNAFLRRLQKTIFKLPEKIFGKIFPLFFVKREFWVEFSPFT